jgi:hypothetical protein
MSKGNRLFFMKKFIFVFIFYILPMLLPCGNAFASNDFFPGMARLEIGNFLI